MSGDPEAPRTDGAEAEPIHRLTEDLAGVQLAVGLPLAAEAGEAETPAPPDNEHVDATEGIPSMAEATGTEETPATHSADTITKPPPIRPTVILNAPDLAGPQEGRAGLRTADVLKLALETGLTRLGSRYECIPPGARTSYPHAHKLEAELVYCISGHGLVWQNGRTYPFGPGDVASWSAGTGVVHCIINDSNADGGPGEDLVLVSASENRAGEAWWYPLSPERRAEIPDAKNWSEGVPPQNEFGPHDGFPSKPLRSTVASTQPAPLEGPRPSNIVHGPSLVEPVGKKDLFCYGTSLSRETGLHSQFGCNLEIMPPGTRSSYPHAHSLEEELVLVLSGHGHLWLNGDMIPVSEGDVVGFPAATGIAHNFINDSYGDGQNEGENLWLWIVGEDRGDDGDKCVYPANLERKATFDAWWHDCPTHQLGPHNGRPKHPRTD